MILDFHSNHWSLVLCTEEGHGQVAACSKCCSTSGHRDPEIWVRSVYADAWRPALAGYSPASAVQARCDSPSLSSSPSSRLPRRLLRASLWSSWSPASAIGQTSSTVVPRVRRGTSAFSVAGPTVWNSLPDCLMDPAVDSEQFRRDVSVRRTLEAIAH